MSLPRIFYEPFYSLSDFDHLFDEAFNARSLNPTSGNWQQIQQGTRSTSVRPRMDVHEDSQQNIVTATFELPGMKKEDVSLDVHNNMLTISGESKISTEREESGYAVRERRFGKFTRSVPLPEGVNSEQIKASLEDGVLTVTFPRTTPEQAPKKISIA